MSSQPSIGIVTLPSEAFGPPCEVAGMHAHEGQRALRLPLLEHSPQRRALFRTRVLTLGLFRAFAVGRLADAARRFVNMLSGK